jgi:peptide deformylase
MTSLETLETPNLIKPLVPKTDPILRTKTERFNFSNPPTDPNELAHTLAQSLIASGGIGLAAPQIGLPYRAFALKSNPILVCFNPIIVDTSSEQTVMEEGCMSFPGLILKIKRPSIIRARYTLPSGETKTDRFVGMTARVFQHEFDHLEGIVFTDHVGSVQLELAKNKAKKRLKRVA